MTKENNLKKELRQLCKIRNYLRKTGCVILQRMIEKQIEKTKEIKCEL